MRPNLSFCHIFCYLVFGLVISQVTVLNISMHASKMNVNFQYFLCLIIFTQKNVLLAIIRCLKAESMSTVLHRKLKKEVHKAIVESKNMGMTVHDATENLVYDNKVTCSVTTRYTATIDVWSRRFMVFNANMHVLQFKMLSRILWLLFTYLKVEMCIVAIFILIHPMPNTDLDVENSDSKQIQTLPKKTKCKAGLLQTLCIQSQ